MTRHAAEPQPTAQDKLWVKLFSAGATGAVLGVLVSFVAEHWWK